MTVTSSTAQKPATRATSQAGRFDFAAAKKILAGSTSFWGAASTVSLLGSAGLKKGPATYNAQAMLKGAGVNLTDEQKQKLAENDRALQQFEKVTKSAQSDRKAAAAEKIKQLKERLKQLMMAGGDPKQIARQAAQLARELKQAVQEYGSASASTGVPTAPQTPANPDGAAAEAASGQAELGESVVNTASIQTERAETANANAKAGEQVPSTNEKAESENRPLLKDIVAKGRLGLDDSKRAEAEAAKAEREFINEIKTLAQQIKALFERKKNEAEKEKGSDMDLTQDGKAVNESMREIDDVVQGLEDALNEKVAGMAAGLMPEAPMDPGMAAAPVGSIVSVIA